MNTKEKVDKAPKISKLGTPARPVTVAGLAGAAHRQETGRRTCPQAAKGLHSERFTQSPLSRSFQSHVLPCMLDLLYDDLSHFNNSFLTPRVLSRSPGTLAKCPACSCLFLTRSQQHGPCYVNRGVKKSNAVRSQATDEESKRKRLGPSPPQEGQVAELRQLRPTGLEPAAPERGA